jgi:hypothetical protein
MNKKNKKMNAIIVEPIAFKELVGRTGYVKHYRGDNLKFYFDGGSEYGDWMTFNKRELYVPEIEGIMCPASKYSVRK